MKASIITDSANDLPEEILKKYGIQFAPLSIAFEDKTFLDGVELSREQFYERLISSKQIPRTSQPSPKAFYDLMKGALEKGMEAVVITLSSGLSGTYESALMARAEFEKKEQERIYIVDSLAASTGQGLLVYEAAKMAQSGKNASEIVEAVEELKRRLCSIFTVDTFEYLLKGGRVTKVQAFIGTVLDIKPVLHLDSSGRIVPLEKVRGKRKAASRLLEIMAEQGHDLNKQTVGVVHAHVPQEAARLAEQIRTGFNVREVIIGELSASIGTHTGPGCLSVFFYR
ncbi:MAG: fatty acid kinase fatty acid binding subunit [Tepidanaerobacteraceae bacterium]|nr:fatty acid kinase fatty acid binding subunit [Tepidanaerobacteraceae bacterium]